MTAGGLYWETPILEIDPAALREVLNVNFESYFCKKTPKFV